MTTPQALNSLGSLVPDASIANTYIVFPGASSPYYASIQSAINAAVAAGERTENNAALVVVLPGWYTENVTLKKHVMVAGLEQRDSFETRLFGTVTCALTLEGGTREKTFTTWRGVNIFPPSGASPGLWFTGSNAQKLILQDTCIEGSADALLMDNDWTSGAGGPSQVLATRCRLRPTSAVKVGLNMVRGYFLGRDCDLWNRIGSNSRVIQVKPGADAKSAVAELSFCDIEGTGIVDGSASTSVAAGSVILSYRTCTHKTAGAAAAPPALLTFTGNAVPTVVGGAFVDGIFYTDQWVAGSALLRGTGATAVPVVNGKNVYLNLAAPAVVPALLAAPLTSVPMISV